MPVPLWLLRVLLTGCREKAVTGVEIGAGGIGDGEVSAQLGEFFICPREHQEIYFSIRFAQVCFGLIIYNFVFRPN